MNTTLKDQIATYNEGAVKQIPPEVLTTFGEQTQKLVDSGIAEQGLKTGDKAPNFNLPNHNNESQSLTAYLEDSAVVLSFYRGGWCPYCNLELNALQEKVQDFVKEGARLVAISPEVPDHSLSTREKNGLSFDILYDEANKVAKSFGLVFELAEVLRPIYDSFGIDVVDHNGDESFELPMPATYVINQQGEIVYHFIDADYTSRSEQVFCGLYEDQLYLRNN